MMSRTIVDYDKKLVIVQDELGEHEFEFDTQDAFDHIGKAMLRVGWDTKYVYGFTWLGRPIIQLPDDIVTLQELIFQVKPTAIVEVGVAHGGSLILYASLVKAMDWKCNIIGIDIEIRKHNRKAIEEHVLSSYITLIEGDSVSQDTVDNVASVIANEDRVLVFLDGNHDKEHVLKELELYSKFVSVGSYIVAMDGIRREVIGGLRTQEDWSWNNPANAAEEFVEKNKNFSIVNVNKLFNEGLIGKPLTYLPSAYIRRDS
jgi:cephalosporin hydroxylase